jgi:hypothetical protein
VLSLTESLKCLEESKEGRKVYTSRAGAKREISKSVKGRVRTFASIKKALGDAQYGQIFTTKAAGRLYVVSKGKWGKKSGRGKIAKGFTKGSATPSADFPSIRKHASRTVLRYGKGSKSLAKKYGSRSLRKKYKVKKGTK